MRGRANEQLLESYTAERRPVIKRVIETTDFLTKTMGTSSKLAQALRDTIIPMLSRLNVFQHRFVENLSELGITYAGSPIVEGEGQRYWDDSIRGGNGISNRFLLFLGDHSDKLTRENGERLGMSSNDRVELRWVPRPGVTLVRPDGYIAYTSHSDHDARSLEFVKSVLERQTA